MIETVDGACRHRIVTGDDLLALHACGAQVTVFLSQFPCGADWFCDADVAMARASGLDLKWLAAHILPKALWTPVQAQVQALWVQAVRDWILAGEQSFPREAA